MRSNNFGPSTLQLCSNCVVLLPWSHTGSSPMVLADLRQNKADRIIPLTQMVTKICSRQTDIDCHSIPFILQRVYSLPLRILSSCLTSPGPSRQTGPQDCNFMVCKITSAQRHGGHTWRLLPRFFHLRPPSVIGCRFGTR